MIHSAVVESEVEAEAAVDMNDTEMADFWTEGTRYFPASSRKMQLETAAALEVTQFDSALHRAGH